MRVTPLATIALCAVPAVAAPSSTADVRSARAAAAEIDRADAALEALLARAGKRYEAERIETYRSYSTDALLDRSRAVRAEEVSGYLAAVDLPAEVRDAAATALASKSAVDADPDLSSETGKGKKRPRAAFSLKLVALLDNRDLLSRSLAKRVLEAYWPGGARDGDVFRYDPRKKETWAPAVRAWDRYLAK